MATLDDEICADIDAALQGTGLNFALVLWCDGKPDDHQSVALSAHPTKQSEARVALQTVLDALALKGA